MSIKSQARKSAARKLHKKPKGKLEPVDLNSRPHPYWMTRAYRNNRCTVMIDDNAKMTGGIVAIKAMVQRHDNTPIPNHWREMQAIKNEIFGDETVAIEFYPPESKLIDCKNIYWLWVFPAGVIPEYETGE